MHGELQEGSGGERWCNTLQHTKDTSLVDVLDGEMHYLLPTPFTIEPNQCKEEHAHAGRESNSACGGSGLC
jgi:hypothetical protein